jgi:chaperonin cofactor prefoldin
LGNSNWVEEVNDAELAKVWTAMDTRIETLNARTKAHTIEIKDLEKAIKELQRHLEYDRP